MQPELLMDFQILFTADLVGWYVAEEQSCIVISSSVSVWGWMLKLQPHTHKSSTHSHSWTKPDDQNDCSRLSKVNRIQPIPNLWLGVMKIPITNKITKTQEKYIFLFFFWLYHYTARFIYNKPFAKLVTTRVWVVPFYRGTSCISHTNQNRSGGSRKGNLTVTCYSSGLFDLSSHSLDAVFITIC